MEPSSGIGGFETGNLTVLFNRARTGDRVAANLLYELALLRLRRVASVTGD